MNIVNLYTNYSKNKTVINMYNFIKLKSIYKFTNRILAQKVPLKNTQSHSNDTFTVKNK